jgi:hypothetical protein
MEKIFKTRAYRRKSHPGGRKVIEILFTPSSSTWILETILPDRLRNYAKDLKILQARLETLYSGTKSPIEKRFKAFSRD